MCGTCCTINIFLSFGRCVLPTNEIVDFVFIVIIVVYALTQPTTNFNYLFNTQSALSKAKCQMSHSCIEL